MTNKINKLPQKRKKYKPASLLNIVCKKCNRKFDTRSRRALYCSMRCAKQQEYLDKSLIPEWRLKKLMAMAKNRSKDKNLKFNLDIEYLLSLWEENQGCCALTGQEFDLSPWGGKSQVSPKAPSIDRVDPKKGYVKGNVRLITYHMNISLSDFGTEEFESLVKAYLRH